MKRPLAYIDPFGVYHAPFGVGLEVAQHLCQLYPDTVMEVVGRNKERDRQASVTGRSSGKNLILQNCTRTITRATPRSGSGVRPVLPRSSIGRLRKIIEDQA